MTYDDDEEDGISVWGDALFICSIAGCVFVGIAGFGILAAVIVWL